MIGSADWSIFVGIITYIIGIVFAAIYYLRYKKVYLIVNIASICTYIFSVFYTWDVFELSRNWILAMLVLSTLVMFFLGKYFSKLELKKAKKQIKKEK